MRSRAYGLVLMVFFAAPSSAQGTVPDADRIGINLKWMLAMCYRQSNRDATPSM